MDWLRGLVGRRVDPEPAVRAVLDDLVLWLQTPTVGYEKQVSKRLDELSKAWHVPVREELARGVSRFFEDRLIKLQTTTTGLVIETDHETSWWDTPSGHIYSISVRFDRQMVGDQLISGRMYQVGRIGANRYLVVGR